MHMTWRPTHQTLLFEADTSFWNLQNVHALFYAESLVMGLGRLRIGAGSSQLWHQLPFINLGGLGYESLHPSGSIRVHSGSSAPTTGW